MSEHYSQDEDFKGLDFFEKKLPKGEYEKLSVRQLHPFRLFLKVPNLAI